MSKTKQHISHSLWAVKAEGQHSTFAAAEAADVVRVSQAVGEALRKGGTSEVVARPFKVQTQGKFEAGLIKF